ncbi:MAG: hypothetical protein OEU94_08490, partial [Aquincola sp.]|nr:hypothetical protein [Aquincola sp.]
MTIFMSSGLPSRIERPPEPTLDAALVQEALKNAGSRSRVAWMAEQLKLSEDDLLPRAARFFGARPLM